MSTSGVPNDPVPVVKISVRDGQLWVDAPRAVLTPELRAALAAEKEMLLALLAADEETAVPPAPQPAPWAWQRVRLEDLAACLAQWGLKVAGGDPDLDGDPWTPKVYVVAR